MANAGSHELSWVAGLATLGIPAEKIHVIGNAVQPSYYPIRDSWLLAAVRERYNIARKYILYFGGFDLRKNVQRIIRSYAAPATWGEGRRS